MPRPKRARRAPTQSAKAAARSPTPEAEAPSDNELPRQDKSPERGRRRTTRASGARLSATDEQAVLATSRRRDAALDRLANEDPTSASGNNAADEDSGSSVEGGRRITATPTNRRDTTGLDLADSVFGDLDDSFDDDGDGERGGMRSTDTSSLNLSNFKRRSRQSSIIGRNDPPIRPSSRGGNTPSISSTLHFGAFRRRAREPSILGTARKPRPEEAGAGQEPDSESEDEEEFLPEAESTPLNNRRRTQPESELEAEREATPEASTGPRRRKRKSEDAVPSSDRPEKMSRVDVEQEEEDHEEEQQEEEVRAASEIDLVDDSASDSSLSSLSSPLGPSPVLPDRPVTPINDEEIMAPPASSDSEDGNDVWPDIHTLAKRRRRPSVATPPRADNFSDVSSPPSLTHSPNYAETRATKTRGRAATRRQPSPKLTTADLTNLLPKRRYKKQRDPLGLESDEEYDTSEMPQGEDELSYVDSRTTRRRQASRPGSRGGRSAQAPKGRQAASNKSKGRNQQTYSRRSSDKENEGEEQGSDNDEHDRSQFQPLPDDTFDGDGSGESSNMPSADELRQAVKKFKEVDRWELDYEEVTQSSSPPGAR
ncbi:RNA helicase [Fusarium solani]|nr:RNA helicase [Fusarium solani]